MTEHAAATEAYAAAFTVLLGYDGYDEEFREELQANCDEAKARMEAAWINHTTGGAS